MDELLIFFVEDIDFDVYFFFGFVNFYDVVIGFGVRN